jgi:hypothetical protein
MARAAGIDTAGMTPGEIRAVAAWAACGLASPCAGRGCGGFILGVTATPVSSGRAAVAAFPFGVPLAAGFRRAGRSVK